MKVLTAVLASLVLCGALAAQGVPPVLFVENDGEDLEALGLAEVEVEVRIFGYLAETEMTMTFANPHDRALAGDLYFPLPEGVTISGYALDIEGRMVDGVVVEKDRGRQVFEKIVRQGIDPGLVEWVGGNNFKTRVFPIPAHGSRTVRVEYVGELVQGNEGGLYHLPLNFEQAVGRFFLRVEVVESEVEPRVQQGGLANFRFGKWRDSFVAETEMKDAVLTEDLIVALPEVERQRALVEEDEEGTVHFAIFDSPSRPKSRKAERPERVAVLWDASGSRGRVDHERELGLLREYFGQFGKGEIEVDLILFRNAAEGPKLFAVERGNCEALIEVLGKVAYDGGTQMGAISPVEGRALPDFYLLFTDGVSNFGTEEPERFERPVYILSADAQTNHAFLHYLAMRSGGAYFNLQRLEDREVVEGIGRTSFSFVDIDAKGVEVEGTYPGLPQPVHGRFALAGRLVGEKAEVVLEYGVGGKVKKRSKYKISRKDAVRGDLVRRFWAQKKVEELSVFPKRNQAELVAVGKRYGLVTPGTSLIVLEDLGQYVEHRIRPPESLPEMRREYEDIVARNRKEEMRKKEDKLQYVLSLWKQRVEWWETEFEYPEDFEYEGDKRGEDGEAMDMEDGEGDGEGLLSRVLEAVGMGNGAGDAAPAPMAEERMMRTSARQVQYEREEAEIEHEMEAEIEHYLPAAKSADSKKADEPAIAIEPWNPDTPYLEALRAADADEWFAVYLKQREEHGRAPAFFLDCAGFFFAEEEKRLGLQVLSNVSELELENAALLRVLGHRLAQLDLLDLSIRLFEQVLELRPEEPQSYRDLALVLARRAAVVEGTAREDYGRAIELLYEVVMKQWDRFAEVEGIALMEINRLIPLAKAAGVEGIPVDPRLVELLDVDVRIVLTWDADMTDMDLWVVEPSGEKAYYGHPLTTIGGRMSRDFTNGYGPEEYCLRKAQHGEYRIEANYFGSSAPSMSGAVTLQAEVFTNYGRPNEKRQAMTLRLNEGKETFRVGLIEF